MFEPGVLSSIFDRHSMITGILEPVPTTLETNKLWKSSGVFRIRKFKRTEGDILLTVQGLEKRYQQGNRTLNILQKLNLRLRGGEITALVGPSGSGKSTLLHILGLLDTPTGGQIIIGDQIVGKMNDSARTRLRNKSIGFVYQFHHLLPEFTALENLMIPQMLRGMSKAESAVRARQLLDYMKIGDRAEHRPSKLSGGEQQRVAIARAVANAPLV
ncbi:MAG: ABC transporter ATP-binding protein, partial [Alphaproteobacteria bacterium]